MVEVAKVSKVAEIAEVAKVSKVAEIAEVAKVAKVSKVAEIAEVAKVAKVAEIAEEYDDDNDGDWCIFCCERWSNDSDTVSSIKYNLSDLCSSCLVQKGRCPKCNGIKSVELNRCSMCCVEPSCHNEHVDIIEFTCSKCVFPHSKDYDELLVPHSCAESNLVCVICNHKNFLVKE